MVTLQLFLDLNVENIQNKTNELPISDKNSINTSPLGWRAMKTWMIDFGITKWYAEGTFGNLSNWNITSFSTSKSIFSGI